MGNSDLHGVVPRVVADIFAIVKEGHDSGSSEYTLTVSYVEIYMEKIRDLMDTSKTNLKIRGEVRKSRRKGNGVYIENVTE